MPFVRYLLQTVQIVETERVEVGIVLYKAFVHQKADVLLAEGFDVHGFARCEMLDTALYLRRTVVFVRAVVVCFAFGTHKRSAAFGTFFYVLYRKSPVGAFFQIDTYYLRYYLPAFFNKNGISYADIEFLYVIGVVKRGALYGSSGQQHRAEIGYGSYVARAANLI